MCYRTQTTEVLHREEVCETGSGTVLYTPEHFTISEAKM